MKTLFLLLKRNPPVFGSAYQLHSLTAGALLLVAICGVVALGGTAAWARSGIQFASFAIAALGTGWLIASARAPRINASMVVCWGIPVWGALQLMLGASVHDFGTRNAILDSAVFGTLFFIAVQTFEDPKLRGLLLETLFIFASLASVVAIFPAVMQRIDGAHYCVFIELLLPIGLYLITEAGDRKMAYVWAVLCASLVASALVTGSIAGCLLIAAEIIFIVAIRGFRGHRMNSNTWLPLAAMLAVVGVFGAAAGWRQLASGDPWGGRKDLAEAAISMARERPLTGFGLGSFKTVYPRYVAIDSGLQVDHAHNDWAEWAGTGGVPLLAMWGTVFGLSLPLLVRRPWAIGVLAMCLHALVDCPFEIPALLVLNALLLGAASAGDWLQEVSRGRAVGEHFGGGTKRVGVSLRG